MHIHGGDVYGSRVELDFSANLNFLGMPESVRAAAKAGVDLAEHYPDPFCRKLREAISAAEDVRPEEIICGNGAADLIFGLVLAKKPRRALLWSPGFYEYEQALRTIDCPIEFIKLRQEMEFQFEEETLSQIVPGIDIVFFCNPHNPTGQVASFSFLQKLLRRCEETGTFCVVDECFLDFVDKGERHSVKSRMDQNPRLFILKAFTKLYAMAGLRLGYGLCFDTEFLARMQEVMQPWNVSVPAQEAGIAALKEKEYVRRFQELLQEERRFLTQEMAAMGYRLYGSKANFIFFQGPTDLAEFCKEQGILIRDCSNYRGLCQGYYRIAVRSHEENIRILQVFRKRA
ncbi:pyridoxal phosphate-dependent aminotransferase [Hominifimenecus sp. rT4P-3]|uniref:pyridoxal phosphate-dependent aminotransferase n=1 Tax=Hominifimenecus sp. rT4P-3 TaxID=3242979 RepID=UPI003DA366FF